MQKCDYCGRENRDLIARCVECGTSLLPDLSQTSSPSPIGLIAIASNAGIGRHRAILKHAMFVVGGVCFLSFAVGFGLVLRQYLLGEAGSQSVPRDTWKGDVVIGFVQVTGLFLAISFSFMIGIYFLANGLVPFQETIHDRAVTSEPGVAVAEPDAAPNGGPAASLDSLNAPGGPPSVS